MKSMVPLAVGAFVGLLVAPKVLDMAGIPSAPGIGMDDVVTVALIVGSIILTHKVL
jgi:hypothetical protein